MWKSTHIFGLRASRNSQKRQISHYRYYRVSKGQWPQMTFERSMCNIKGQMWSCADLNHAWYVHSCYCSKLRGWKHDFLEKSVVGCTSYDVITPWPDLTRSTFPCQKLHKGCAISYTKCQRDPPCGSEAIPEKLMGVSHRRLARARVTVRTTQACVP